MLLGKKTYNRYYLNRGLKQGLNFYLFFLVPSFFLKNFSIVRLFFLNNYKIKLVFFKNQEFLHALLLSNSTQSLAVNFSGKILLGVPIELIGHKGDYIASNENVGVLSHTEKNLNEFFLQIIKLVSVNLPAKLAFSLYNNTFYDIKRLQQCHFLLGSCSSRFYLMLANNLYHLIFRLIFSVSYWFHRIFLLIKACKVLL